VQHAQHPVAADRVLLECTVGCGLLDLYSETDLYSYRVLLLSTVALDGRDRGRALTQAKQSSQLPCIAARLDGSPK
jgi:hypothetical protein